MVDQQSVPVSFIRGGTSKGLFFLEADLPTDAAARRRIFLSAIGSPDPSRRQLDGMGGGVSSLSKVMVVRRSARPGIDIDYLFYQVSVDRAQVDTSANCGNLSAAVAVFAVDRALVHLPDGPGTVVMFNENTGKRVDCHLTIRGGRAAVLGDFEIEGVAGLGAPIRLDFLDPGGAGTGALLPTGRPSDEIVLSDGGVVEASIVDASNLCVFVGAAALGLAGTERPDALADETALLVRLEEIRTRAAVLAGFCDRVEATPDAAPKIAVVGPAACSETLSGGEVGVDSCDVQIRMLSMGVPHLTIPLTGAMCAAVAARIAGSTLHSLVGDRPPGEMLRVAHGSGVLPVLAEVRQTNQGWEAQSVSVVRTVRTLMEGNVLVPAPAMVPGE